MLGGVALGEGTGVFQENTGGGILMLSLQVRTCADLSDHVPFLGANIPKLERAPHQRFSGVIPLVPVLLSWIKARGS